MQLNINNPSGFSCDTSISEATVSALEPILLASSANVGAGLSNRSSKTTPIYSHSSNCVSHKKQRENALIVRRKSGYVAQTYRLLHPRLVENRSTSTVLKGISNERKANSKIITNNLNSALSSLNTINVEQVPVDTMIENNNPVKTKKRKIFAPHRLGVAVSSGLQVLTDLNVPDIGAVINRLEKRVLRFLFRLMLQHYMKTANKSSDREVLPAEISSISNRVFLFFNEIIVPAAAQVPKSNPVHGFLRPKTKVYIDVS